ncbi:MAG: beta-lactamase family protein [Muribaculaceae bacterium]|nr:beta-lactamase family protein [Muribaculaceae bacterium]
MKKIVYLILAVVAITLAAGCRRNASLNGDLDRLFNSVFPADAPGAVVVIEKDGKIIYDKGFGLARLDGDRKIAMSDSTVVCIASVSKQFAAVAVMMLQERGLLSVNDTLTKYFPQYPDSIFGRITIAHLLSHTSGLPDARPRTAAEWEKYRSWHKGPYNDLDSFKRRALWEESCAFFERLDSVAFLPGERYEYQNPTFQLLLPIIEQTTGENFDAWMAENIFKPAGMTNTAYFHEGYEPANMAHGYIRNADGAGWEEHDFGEANFFPTKADGALYTSALDFLRWDHALYGDRLMSARSREEAHTPRVSTDLPYASYGYGFFIEERPGMPRKVFHTGDNGGFLLHEGRYEDENLFYLVFAVQPDWDREATVEKLDRILLGHGLLKMKKQD